jgi:hypothetical protein
MDKTLFRVDDVFEANPSVFAELFVQQALKGTKFANGGRSSLAAILSFRPTMGRAIIRAAKNSGTKAILAVKPLLIAAIGEEDYLSLASAE